MCLQVIDNLWTDHLEAIDDLREGIGLRGYAQRDPLVEYKSEAFNMFEKLMVGIESEIAHRIFKVQVTQNPQIQKPRNMQTNANLNSGVETHHDASLPQGERRKLGRNDPCWCGKTDSSGRPIKWKKCHYPDPGPN